MQRAILKRDAFQVMGIELQTSNHGKRSHREIPEHWDRFYGDQIHKRIPGRVDDTVYALYTNYHAGQRGQYSLVLGYQVSPDFTVPKDLVTHTVPAARYAVFTASGSYPDSILKTWEHIWNTDLPRAFTGDFEIYDPGYVESDWPEVPVYIALE